MREGYCMEHNNFASLICINSQCKQRLMCMVCQHNHQLYTSIRNKQQVQYRCFIKKVDDVVDRSLQLMEKRQDGVEQQKIQIMEFYQKIKNQVGKYIDQKMQQNLILLNSNTNSDISMIIKARIQGKYYKLSSQIFSKIKDIYQGKDLESLIRQQQQKKLSIVYRFMKDVQKNFKQFFDLLKIKNNLEIPQIRFQQSQKTIKKLNRIQQTKYSTQDEIVKQHPQIKHTSTIVIDQIITDAYSTTKQIITIGLDKTLRIFNKNLQIINSKQYKNILTKISNIGQNIFIIAVSKQLFINKIAQDNRYEPKQIMILKGHTSRIWDLSHFNTRIIGSSSEEGIKIWDLYKQKCQYTLKQQINPSCLCFMNNALTVGYHNHQLKIYSIQKMKLSKMYQLNGVPLHLGKGNVNDNLIYCGGFSSDLKLFDTRVEEEVVNVNFKSEAVTTFQESLINQNTILVGERGGKARVFDLRRLKSRVEWQAHQKMTNLSKPNGVVRICQQGQNQVLTVGCNDRKAIIWKLQNQQ